ncbi:MAG TPA: DUF3108 domain-containing protein [Bacteroidales bacterium]|nr:DUF3108 domain-containing protein [Bacteroidales bacterium]
MKNNRKPASRPDWNIKTRRKQWGNMITSKFAGLILLLFLLNRLPVQAQCPVSNDVFGDGEQIRYLVTYNWGPVWVDAGTVTFTAKSDTYRGKPAWHLIGSGKSFRSYDMLYKVRDYYDSWIDPGTFHSFDFRRNVYEGGYTLLNTLYFDRQFGRVISNTKCINKPQRTDTMPIRPCTFDMLAAIYYVRTMDFASMKSDQKTDLTVLIDDAYYDIYIRPLGKEVVEANDGKRYRCQKFAAKMVSGTIFKGDEDVVVWVSDDANKVPIYIEAKIIVGTIKAYLKDFKGLKRPFGCIVK